MSHSQSIQEGLNVLAHVCVREGERIRPCEYHADRLRCVPFAIADDVVEDCGHTRGRLRRCKDITSLAHLFERGTPPAGGWYLVREQREWLEKMLVDTFAIAAADQRSSVTILQAGSAGHVHHMTYLKVVASALGRFPSLSARVVAADRCVLPIEAIHAITAHPGTARHVVGGIEVRVPRELQSELVDDVGGRLAVEAVVVDLRDRAAVEAIVGPVDVITEHFLTSLLSKDLGEIDAVRRAYLTVLRPGGVLLSAAGFGAASPLSREYVAIHDALGLRLRADDVEAVWDPYGLERGELADFARQRRSTLGVSLNNTLSAFDRVVG